MVENIVFRAVIEVVGKPKEHVEESLKNYVSNLKKDERYNVISENYAEIKQQKDEDFWACFVELEIKTLKAEDLTRFSFEFMPAIIEIVEPTELKFSQVEFSQYLNDLQAKLHNVDMIAKQAKMESESLNKNSVALLTNYIIVLLHSGNMTSNRLAEATGMSQDKIEDFLDKMIDDGKIDLKEGIYFLKNKEG